MMIARGGQNHLKYQGDFVYFVNIIIIIASLFYLLFWYKQTRTELNQ